MATRGSLFLTLALALSAAVWAQAPAVSAGAGSAAAELGEALRISDMEDVEEAAVVYNSVDNEYLVVWHGKDGQRRLTFGQRIDAATGEEVGPDDFRISNTDGARDHPAAAYDPDLNQYLVVWDFDGTIEGQLLDGSSGTPVGQNDFLVTPASAFGTHPAVAYNPLEFEYLVVWQDGDGLISGQRLASASGAKVEEAFAVSGLTGPLGLHDTRPDLVHNSTQNEYLVVWQTTDGHTINENSEVFGQRIDGASGDWLTEDEFPISDAGEDRDFDAYRPAVAYSSEQNEYLVVWHGDDDAAGLVEGELEVLGQLIDGATGAEVGQNDFLISDFGGTGAHTPHRAQDAAVAYNASQNEYLVTWWGSDNADGLQTPGQEIFGQRLLATDGSPVGDNDFRISFSGNAQDYPEGSAQVHNPLQNEYFVVWKSDDSSFGIPDLEFEVFGVRLSTGSPCHLLTASSAGPGGPLTLLPESSTECGLSHFVAGEVVEVTADPEPLALPIWSGTIDDSSTELVNFVDMPDQDHTVTVIYSSACHELSLNHSGSGEQPTWSPESSDGCESRHFHTGQTVTLTALPDPGFQVGRWEGTVDDTSRELVNTVQMPDGSHAVSVSYELPSFFSDDFESGFFLAWDELNGPLASDDFEVGADQNWTTFSEGWILEDGVYRSTNTDSNAPTSAIWEGADRWSHYRVEASVQVEMSTELSGSGLVFLFEDELPSADRCQCFLGLDDVGKNLSLFCGETEIVEKADFEWQEGSWYRLRATTAEGQVTCEVLDQDVPPLVGESLLLNSSGHPGLRSTGQVARYDDFLVEYEP